MVKVVRGYDVNGYVDYISVVGDEVKIRYRTNHWLPKLLKVNAITIYPYIFVDVDNPRFRLVAHELRHIDQVRFYGWFRFYISYLVYYLGGRIAGLGHLRSYIDIPYERDARDIENDKLMLKRAKELMR